MTTHERRNAYSLPNPLTGNWFEASSDPIAFVRLCLSYKSHSRCDKSLPKNLKLTYTLNHLSHATSYPIRIYSRNPENSTAHWDVLHDWDWVDGMVKYGNIIVAALYVHLQRGHGVQICVVLLCRLDEHKKLLSSLQVLSRGDNSSFVIDNEISIGTYNDATSLQLRVC